MQAAAKAAKGLGGGLGQNPDNGEVLEEDNPDTAVPVDNDENEAEGFSPS
ncbi:MAG: hypothetical protein WC582_02790 [Patescibacteria group bacterium]|jgi:hypothetical protein